MKIAVGMASSGVMGMQTVETLVKLFKSDPTMGFIYKQSCYVHYNRETIAEEALAGGYEYLFFVDSDMKFEPDVLSKLLVHNKDIVGAIYNKRLDPPTKIFNVRHDPLPNKLFKQNILASGCMLIKMEVFKKLPKPWFFLGTETLQLGEDVYFCKKARENGIELWCDPTLNVGHVGEKVY